MNLYYFISRKLHNVGKNTFTFLVSRIAIYSIAIGLAVMLVSFSILEGFQQTIRDKIFSFGAHLQVTKYDTRRSYEETPFSKNISIYQDPSLVKDIKHVQVFSQNPGLLKTDEEIMGVIFKGIDRDFNIEMFRNNIVAGDFITFRDTVPSHEVLLSQKIADQIRLDVGDSVLIYFVQNPPRFRKLMVKGIYQTGLEELDELMILGDIALSRRINNWDENMVGGLEIFVKDFSRLDDAANRVYDAMEFDLQLEKVTDKYLQIFDWLVLLNRNVVIFFILILFVACFNMVSTLFIMIMERTNMIGVLKALGAANQQIQAIFIYNGLFIILKGMLLGNLIGLSCCFIQYYFQIIPLDPENYYMDRVPIEWNWLVIAGLNLMTFVLIALILILPVVIISRIKPIKSIKFN